MYSKNIGKLEKDLIFDFCLVTSLYLVINFGYPIFDDKLFLIVNIPLFLAYLRKRKMGIIFLSLMIVVYYYSYFDFSLLILFWEYILYFILYVLYVKDNKNYVWYIGVFKCIIFMFLMLIHAQTINIELFSKLIVIIFSDIFIIFVVLMIYKTAEDIIKYHMSLKELEQNKQLRSTLFKITHEIKNPIAVCKGYLEMFDVNNIKHSQKYVPILKTEIERTLILLQDFLSMTQIQIEYERIDVNAVLEDVIDNFIPIFKEKNINYEVDIASDFFYINGDYNRLTQVFINIIKNSIEALDPKRVGNIKISSKVKDKWVIICIEDNGIGLSKEQLEKLGEPFNTTKPNGTGLGITLSKEIIKAHNGEINYFSKFNKGTTVEIKIPLANEKGT